MSQARYSGSSRFRRSSSRACGFTTSSLNRRAMATTCWVSLKTAPGSLFTDLRLQVMSSNLGSRWSTAESPLSENIATPRVRRLHTLQYMDCHGRFAKAYESAAVLRHSDARALDLPRAGVAAQLLHQLVDLSEP